ncbi:MAG: DNA polymerase III subunit epsilon [Moraxellaceae bacterium]|nr:DNA polymerase III subunit epsilon [Moraxellaceae bacterium]
MRQIVLDTETTGIDPSQGHRLIEIGCLEMVNRRLTGRSFHHYLNPEREVDPEAERVHGLSNAFLADKPLFASVADEFLAFVRGAELIIHNAPFDIGFLDHELKRLGGRGQMADITTVLDTLVMARSRHPGQKNNLDALVRRYEVAQRDRAYHGALLDAEILADVYLAMTGGQVGLSLGSSESGSETDDDGEMIRRLPASRQRLAVIPASAEERQRHEAKLQQLDKAAAGACLWRTLDPSPMLEKEN